MKKKNSPTSPKRSAEIALGENRIIPKMKNPIPMPKGAENPQMPLGVPAPYELKSYRKRPETIQATRVGEASPAEWDRLDNLPIAKNRKLQVNRNEDSPIIDGYIETLEGVQMFRTGDWLIRGISGEWYPCKHDIFLKTYDPAPSDLGDGACGPST